MPDPTDTIIWQREDAPEQQTQADLARTLTGLRYFHDEQEALSTLRAMPAGGCVQVGLVGWKKGEVLKSDAA